MPSNISPGYHPVHPESPGSPDSKDDSLAELERAIAAGGFWRLAPDWCPREYVEPTRELIERVRNGLRRLIT